MSIVPVLESGPAAADCPCLTSLAAYNITGRVVPRIGGVAYDYGNDYGIGACAAHDLEKPPGCAPNLDSADICSQHADAPQGVAVPAWCLKWWCYVDGATCQRDKAKSGYNLAGLAEGGSQGFLYYSYATCGSCDTFSSLDDPFTLREAEEAHMNNVIAVVAAAGVVLLLLLLLAWRERKRCIIERKVACERLRYCSDGTVVTPLVLKEPLKYHAFLSHSWKDGSAQMRIVKDRLREIVPQLKVFLDVDDLVFGTGPEAVDTSELFVCFVTSTYAHSANCMRELCRACLTGKRVLMLLEQDPQKGGLTLGEALHSLERALSTDDTHDERHAQLAARLAKELPQWYATGKTTAEMLSGEELRKAVLQLPALQWSRKRELQMVTLRLLAQHVIVPSQPNMQRPSRKMWGILRRTSSRPLTSNTAPCEASGSGDAGRVSSKKVLEPQKQRATIRKMSLDEQSMPNEPSKENLIKASSSKDHGGVEPCYIASELVRQRVALPTPREGHKFHVYCSPNNEGASELMTELRKAHDVDVHVSTNPSDLRRRNDFAGNFVPRGAERFLIYLNGKTWTSAKSAAFAKEVAEALEEHIPMLLVHEEPLVTVRDPKEDEAEAARHAVVFNALIFDEGTMERVTPHEVMPIYDYVSVPMNGGMLRSTSRVLLAQAIAKPPVVYLSNPMALVTHLPGLVSAAPSRFLSSAKAMAGSFGASGRFSLAALIGSEQAPSEGRPDGHNLRVVGALSRFAVAKNNGKSQIANPEQTTGAAATMATKLFGEDEYNKDGLGA